MQESLSTRVFTEDICRVKALCGSCLYVNEPYELRLSEKHEREKAILIDAGLLQDAIVLPPIPSPKKLGYRASFKLAVSPSLSSQQKSDHEFPSDRFAIGLYRPGTHEIVQIDDCPLHTSALRRLIFDLRELLNASELRPFDEKTQVGEVRYLTARSATTTGEIIITFVVTRPLRQPLLRIVHQLRKRNHKITASFMNINARVGNAIFGDETVLITGQNYLRERVCELDIAVPPTAFFQVNPWQAQYIYRCIEQHVGLPFSNPIVWDFYCGLGQIGLILARKGFHVFGVEENPASIEAAHLNAKRNGLLEKVSFVASKVEDVESRIPDWAKRPSWIIVNPSRRGLDANARHFIIQKMTTASSKMLYLSCDVNTLARDLHEFQSNGVRIKQVESFDMFAQTDRLEWLAILMNK